ncbi:hypothetical protein Acr_07g0013510 [Actinidia rufa]|uniref:Uncharacterized protein n=1 Tax=Actinidia rufa TaxID=165716 RepID=A0A7J0EXI1_9ERIC|nr:hypothetical protein Acr_07g0013510 [Actinidia rufa]
MMNEDDIDRLRETYSFPVGIQARIPDEVETILSTRPGKVRSGKNLIKGPPAMSRGGRGDYFFYLGGKLRVLPESSLRQMSTTGSKNMGHPSGDNTEGKSTDGAATSSDEEGGGGHVRDIGDKIDSCHEGNGHWEGTSTNPGNAMGPRASMLGSASMAEKNLSGMIIFVDKEKVDKLSPDQVVSKFFYIVCQGHKEQSHVLDRPSRVGRDRDGLSSKLDHRAGRNHGRVFRMGVAEELMEKSDAVARLEGEVAKLKKNKVLTKKKAVEAYKSSEDFQEALESAGSIYFGEGFNFCNRQLSHYHPNLGIDLDNMGLDLDLLEEEEEEEEEEEKGEDKEEENKEG